MNDITPRIVFDSAQIDLIKRTLLPKGMGNAELDLFLHHAKRAGLDPLARQIYAMEVNGKLSVQVSIDGFRLVAERSGVYAGQVGPFWCGEDGQWRDVWLDSRNAPVAAKVGVLRSDFKEPLFAVARFEAYASRRRDGSLTAMWSKMGDLMIAKCAESQALRRAFPQELSGLYSEDEMQQAEDAPEAPVAQKSPGGYTFPSPPNKPLPAPPQGAVYDPETGEVGPHPIPVPMTRDGKPDWIRWGGALVTELQRADSLAEGEEWLAQCEAAMDECLTAFPKVHERIAANVRTMRLRLGEPPADFMSADDPLRPL